MAGARTVVTLPAQTVTATLTPGANAFITISIACAGLGVGVSNEGEFWGPAQGEEVGDPPDEEEEWEWLGEYWHIQVEIQGDDERIETEDIFVWLGDAWEDTGADEPPEWDPGGVVENAVAIVATLSFQNVIRTATVTENEPPTRGFIGFIDRQATDKWLWNETTIWTVSATWEGGSLSLNGSPGDSTEFADFPCSVSMSLYPNQADDGVTQASITNWSYAGTSYTLAETPLYKLGATGTIPDSDTAPYWGREAQDPDDHIEVSNGAIKVNGSLPGWTEADGYVGRIWLPVDVTFKQRQANSVPVGRHADDVTYPFEVQGAPIQWTEDPPGTWTSSVLPWTGTKQVLQQRRSWLFEYEWRTLSSLTQTAIITSAWTAANEEVSEDNSCPLLLHPIDTGITGDPTTAWPTFVTIGRENNLPVVAPAGVDRPADWTAGAGVTVDEGNNDLWHVDAGASAPTVTLSLASRKFTRLGRLAEHTADTDFKDGNMTIHHKPNEDEWDYASYIDPPADRIPENEWHWKNHTFLKFSINAPRTATLTLTVNYSTLSYVFDPFYTCFTHRFGTEGEYTYTREYHTRTYEFAVAETESGFTDVNIDLMVPTTGTPVPDFYHVNSLQVSLPSTVGLDAEDWELDDIRLVVDAVEGESYSLSVYDPYDYDSISGDYTGLRARIDGKPCFDIRYGMEAHETTERCGKPRQVREHCPLSGATTILHYAKTLASLILEVNLQRGWTAVSANAEEAACNKDALGTKMVSTFYWFDLLRCHESGFTTWPGSPITRTWKILGGTPYYVYYEGFPQARGHGMAVKADRSGRSRSTGTVLLQQRPTAGGDWTTVDTQTPDAWGYYRLGPAKQGGNDSELEYRVGTPGDWSPIQGSPALLRNRRYTLWNIIGGGYLAEPHLFHDTHGGKWLLYTSDGDIHYRRAWVWDDLRSDEACNDYGQITNDGLSGYGWADKAEDGTIVLVREYDGQSVYVRTSSDNTATWSSDVAIATGEKPRCTLFDRRLYLCRVTEGVVEIARSLVGDYSTLDAWPDDSTWKSVGSSSDAPGLDKDVGTGEVVAALTDGSEIDIYVSDQDGQAMVQAT